MNKIIHKGQSKGFPLIKIQTEEVINLIRKASIRFNSLKIYRDFYNQYGDKTIGDPNEGKFFIHNAKIEIPMANINEEVKDCYLATANENDFVFSLFGINPQKYNSFVFSEEQKKKLIDFHDKALLITDVQEFYKRLYTVANKRVLKMTNGFVHYYDPTIDDVGRLCSLVVQEMQCATSYKNNKGNLTKVIEHLLRFRLK